MKKTNNLIKYFLFAVLAIFVLVFALPFFVGMFSSLKPNKAIQMAEQKKLENSELSLPNGYAYLSKAEAVDLGTEKIYVTKLSNGKFTINLIKQSVLPKCAGTEGTIQDLDVCMKVIQDTTGLNMNSYVWKSKTGIYQLDVPFDSISQEELEALMLSI